MDRPSHALASLAAAALWTCAGAALTPAASLADESLVPASFDPRRDVLGFDWDVNPSGFVMDGTDDAFDGAALLRVDDILFMSVGRVKVASTGELVLEGRAGAGRLRVTRRIWLDEARGLVRYVDIFENGSDRLVTPVVQVGTRLGTRK
ncbi:MAG: hypothetical protein L0206_21400, partial [Actinobacteria bacterium]|nr:hypothetical protein [Actinomycetota bacterium]